MSPRAPGDDLTVPQPALLQLKHDQADLISTIKIFVPTSFTAAKTHREWEHFCKEYETLYAEHGPEHRHPGHAILEADKEESSLSARSGNPRESRARGARKMRNARKDIVINPVDD